MRTRIATLFLWILFVVIAFLFSLFRLYNIQNSLEFYNDMGRDFLVLYDWQTTGKPPLLGPQTSTLAFNQSAFYFYILFPLYFLTNGSLFSSVYTSLIFSLCCFALTFALIRKHAREFTAPFLLFFVLASLHPQLIIQQRFIWNPSFLLPLLTIATVTFLIAMKTWKPYLLWLSGLTLSFALALSYSATPILAAFIIVGIYFFRRKVIHLFASISAGLAVWNLPTFVFELRHGFLLTNMLFSREALQRSHLGIAEKISALGTYLFSVLDTRTIPGLSVLFGIIILIFIRSYAQKKKSTHLAVFLLFVLTFLLTLLSPFDIQSHYIFPLLTSVLFLVSFLPLRAAIGATVFISLLWIHPLQIQVYLKQARRTVQQLESCATLVCSKEKDPMFVSEQAGYHVFHNGPEYRFLFKKYGCDIKTIETESVAASTMAIIVDNAEYEHGKTSYNELTLFGPSRVRNTYTCDGGVQVITTDRF